MCLKSHLSLAHAWRGGVTRASSASPVCGGASNRAAAGAACVQGTAATGPPLAGAAAGGDGDLLRGPTPSLRRSTARFAVRELELMVNLCLSHSCMCNVTL